MSVQHKFLNLLKERVSVGQSRLGRGQCAQTSPRVLLLALQDSSGMRLWKRRWFVLADYCLFYYKGEPGLEPQGLFVLWRVGGEVIQRVVFSDSVIKQINNR